jgi:hypothetical protein
MKTAKPKKTTTAKPAAKKKTAKSSGPVLGNGGKKS